MAGVLVKQPLGNVDFVRVLGLKAMADRYLPYGKAPFLKITWQFLGRCRHIVCVPEDAPTLVKGLADVNFRGAEGRKRAWQLTQQHASAKSRETLRETLQCWRLEDPGEHVIYLTGLGYGTDCRIIRLGPLGQTQLTVVKQYDLNCMLGVEACVTIGNQQDSRAIHDIVNYHGAHTSSFRSKLGIDQRVPNTGLVSIWTDVEEFKAAMNEIKHACPQVTLQLSPGTYTTPSELSIRASEPIRIVGGGSDAAAVKVSTYGIIVSSGPWTDKILPLELSNMTFIAADRMLVAEPCPKKRTQDACDADVDGLSSKIASLQLGSGTVRNKGYGRAARRVEGLATAEHTSLVELQGRTSMWLHHCVFEGGQCGVNAQGKELRVESCEFRHARTAGVMLDQLKAATVIGNTFLNNAIAIHVSSNAKAEIKGNLMSYLEAAPEFASSGVKLKGMEISNASAVIEDNTISGYETGIFLKSCKSCTLKNNCISGASGAAVLIHAPWTDVKVLENKLNNNYWGLLARSVTTESSQLRTAQAPSSEGVAASRNLLIADNEIRNSNSSAVLVLGGGFGGRIRIKICKNIISGNYEGVRLSGASLRRLHPGLVGLPWNATLEGNSIEESHTAAMTVERGAAAELLSNQIFRNGRGVAVKDGVEPGRACRVKVQGNTFAENNGWALRFSLLAYPGRSSEDKAAELHALLQRSPEEEHARILLSQLLPQLVRLPSFVQRLVSQEPSGQLIKLLSDGSEITRLCEHYKQELENRISSIKAQIEPTSSKRRYRRNSLLDLQLAQAQEELRQLLLSKSTSAGSSATIGGATMDRDATCQSGLASAVLHNTFCMSGKPHGRGAFGCRTDSTCQQPYVCNNLDQNGFEVKALLGNDTASVAAVLPQWMLLEECISRLQGVLAAADKPWSAATTELCSGKRSRSSLQTWLASKAAKQKLLNMSCKQLEDLLNSGEAMETIWAQSFTAASGAAAARGRPDIFYFDDMLMCGDGDYSDYDF